MANALLYGFMQLKDLLTTRAIELDPDLMISAITMTQQQHDAEVNAILNLFSEPQTVEQLKFNGAAVTRNQPMDQNARPLPIKPAAPYTVGFPIWTSGNAWGANFITNAKMTVQQVNNLISNLIYGDFAWLRDQVLGALFNNTSYTFKDPIVGDIPVKGLANGDTVNYVISTSGADSLAADTHYLAQASAIGTSTNPFPTIYTELTEHPENGTEVICFINSAEAALVSALPNFVPVSSSMIEPASTAARLIGTPGVVLPGRAKLLGATDNCWIVQWNAIPATYVLGIAVGGAPPLVRRIDPEPELQGFKILMNAFWTFSLGF
jgi:hypothetical protein